VGTGIEYAEETVVIVRSRGCGCRGVGTWALVGGQAGLQYRTAAVEHGDINVAVSATGNPNAVVTVQVGTQVSGVILALFADFNTKVTKGQFDCAYRARALPGEGRSGPGESRCLAGPP